MGECLVDVVRPERVPTHKLHSVRSPPLGGLRDGCGFWGGARGVTQVIENYVAHIIMHSHTVAADALVSSHPNVSFPDTPPLPMLRWGV